MLRHIPTSASHKQGWLIAAGGVLYTVLTVLLDRLGMMPADGFETARFFYNIATGLFGIGLGLTGALRTARRKCRHDFAP